MGTPQFALHLFFTAAAYNKNAAALQKQDSCAFVIYPAALVRRLCFLLCSSGCFLVDLALIIHREHDDQNGHSGKDHGDGRGGDGKEVAALDVHVADEVLFAHGSQNESQQNGRKRELVLIHQPANDAEGYANAHIKGIFVDGEGTQQRDDQNDGVQHLFLHRNDLGKEADAQTAYSQHTEVCQHQSRKHAVNGGQLSDIHHGARGDALHDKGTQQDRGDGVAGNTQRQQRDHSTAGAAVVGRLGSSNAVGDTGAVQLRVLAGRLAGTVGDEHRNITACTGDSTDEGADKAAGKDVGPDLTDGFEIRQHIGDLFLRLLLLLLAADDALHAGDDLGDGEQTDQCGDELEAVQQAGLLGGDKARDAIGGIQTYGTQQHTKEGADQTLCHRFAGDGNDDGQTKDSQHEHFAGAKVHGHISHQRREEGHDQSTDDAAAEGSEHCNGQSLAGLSLLAHGLTVQQGGGSSRGAGGMDQDGRDRAAVHTAAVDAQQQADGRDQIHTKRERNEQRHAHGGGHARDRAQQNAAVQAVPLPKKADFYASAAQAQQSPYLSAACFSVLLFPLFTVPRLFAAVCIFSRKRPKAAYPKYAVLETEL